VSTTGTYNFGQTLTASQIVLEAFARLQLRGPAITQQHMEDARLSCNFLNSEWSNRGVALWDVALYTVPVPLVQGVPTITLPPETVMLLDVYIDTGTAPNVTSRYMYPLSRTEYAQVPNKQQQGFPSTYWFDRLITPTITLWQVPDGNGPYTLKMYVQNQMQDTALTGTKQADLPFRMLDAYASGLAARLAEKWAPDKYEALEARYEKAWTLGAGEDTENVALHISPMLASYYKR
jgi:hypothetical protein